MSAFTEVPMPKVIVVSNRLPVSIIEQADKVSLKRSIGGLATAMGSLTGRYPMLWIGWGGIAHPLTKDQIKRLRFPKTLVPIAISTRLLARYYDRIANGILWPMLHGLRPSTLSQEADWQAVKKVVSRFAEAIQQNLEPDDVIWIHDYHLVLLPKVLRDAGVTQRIGFFLHTPFPPFQTLSRAKFAREMLESLSQVDVMGFQTERDMRHFKECLKAMDIDMRRGATVRPFPIGIDFDTFRKAASLVSVTKYFKAIQTLKPRGHKVILSVSRLDYTKGIVEQLKAAGQAIEQLIPKKVTYKLIVAPSREAQEEYRKLHDKIEQTVAEINDHFKRKYGLEPIEYSYRSYGFEELNAWYQAADVLLVTPVIDGMNLVVKEYIAARHNNRGAVVLSRTIGAAFQLKKAILVDPTDVEDITRGLVKALSLPVTERAKRWRALARNVRDENVFWWARSFMSALTHQPAAKRAEELQEVG